MEYIAPHRVISREVTEGDLLRVKLDAKEMYTLYSPQSSFLALSHCQVTDKDPLRFFILSDGTVIVNPVIERHVNYTVDSQEGCMTFPENDYIIKKRWRKIEAKWFELQEDKLIERTGTVKDLPSFVFQHEINHMDGIYCYDDITTQQG